MSPAKAAAASSSAWGILTAAFVIVDVVETLLTAGEVERETEEETDGEGESRSCGKTDLVREDDEAAGEEVREIDWKVSIDCEELVLGQSPVDEEGGGKVDARGLKIGSGIEAVGDVGFSTTFVLEILAFFTGVRVVVVETGTGAVVDGVGADSLTLVFKGPVVDAGLVDTGSS